MRTIPLAFVIVSVLLHSLISFAQEGEQHVSPSSLRMAVLDVRKVQTQSVARTKMYEQANELAKNLDYLIVELENLSKTRWNTINNDASGLSLSDKEKEVEAYRLWTEASERFVINRRLQIENAVAQIDASLRDQLMDDVINQYATEQQYDLILRDTQVVFSKIPDITDDIIAQLNATAINLNLQLTPLSIEQALSEIDVRNVQPLP